MNIFRILLVVLFSQVVFLSPASASDFDWMRNLEVVAEADSSGFHIQLATRFHLGDAQINAVISNVSSSADAYMVFRLGELSHRPINEVMSVYRTHRKRGWGVMAKQLGIKPGSREFHALKRGHDMKGGHSGGGHPTVKHHGKGKGDGEWHGKR